MSSDGWKVVRRIELNLVERVQSFLKIKPSSLPPPSPLVHDSRAVEEQSKRRTTERLNSEYTARRNITPGSSPAFPFFPIRARRLAIYSSSPPPPLSLYASATATLQLTLNHPLGESSS